MSEKKELQVAALKNGTVIDHIPSDKVFTVVSLLDLQHVEANITIGNQPGKQEIREKRHHQNCRPFFSDEEISRTVGRCSECKIKYHPRL